MAPSNGKPPRNGSKRPASSYRSSAKELAKLIPSTAKYAKRKTFSPAEKAAITRAENKAREFRNVIPVSKSQAKLLGKGALIGNGIRGVALEGFGRDSKLVVRHGNPFIESTSRGVRLQKLEYDRTTYEEKIEKLFGRASKKGKRLTVWLWTARGRTHQGFRSETALGGYMAGIFEGAIYDDAEDWLIGLQYLEE